MPRARKRKPVLVDGVLVPAGVVDPPEIKESDLPPLRLEETVRQDTRRLRGRCTRCGRWGSRTEMIRPPHSRVHQVFCPPCWSALAEQWQGRGRKESKLNYEYQRTYGMTLEEYGNLFLEQGGMCRICGHVPEGRPLVVDHDHETGAVRGLLCHTCNSALGLFKDNPASLAMAIAYLLDARRPIKGKIA